MGPIEERLSFRTAGRHIEAEQGAKGSGPRPSLQALHPGDFCRSKVDMFEERFISKTTVGITDSDQKLWKKISKLWTQVSSDACTCNAQFPGLCSLHLLEAGTYTSWRTSLLHLRG